MAGYFGYSMSNNAVDAYENGEKPLSRWSKADIIREVEFQREEDGLLPYSFNLNNLTKNELSDIFLCYSSWHHISKVYNVTNFYRVDIDNVTEETLRSVLECDPQK